MKNMINWFEIPVKEIGRARKFYETLLDVEINTMEIHGSKMGFFPNDGKSISGALVEGQDYSPSNNGALIYLNGGKDLSTFLNRVEKLGGKVLAPKTQISPEQGYFGIFKDTEGNKLAFHSIS